MWYFDPARATQAFQFLRPLKRFVRWHSKKMVYLNRTVKTTKSQPVSSLLIWDGITIKELASATNRPLKLILSEINSRKLISGHAHANSSFEDRNSLVSMVHLLGFKAVFKPQPKIKLIDKDAKPRPPPDPTNCLIRPPVVAVLGHVDHGKTTLLDALRASRMVDFEFGGITQHLAAFTVSLSTVAQQAGLSYTVSDTISDHITFIDTPGHAAFAGIRARGAAVTDMIVLVVAADDGVMPQTVESIRFAKETNTPIVVAINKVDKREADVDSVIEELAVYDVVVEKLGGEIQAIPISALRRRNLHKLLESICVQAEVMQLKADPSGPCEAVVLEACIDDDTGRVATCLVTRGKLRTTPASGPLVAGEALCSPRFLLNDLGQRVPSVSPGYIARVPGWKTLPPAGSLVLELPSMTRAQEVIRFRTTARMEQKHYRTTKFPVSQRGQQVDAFQATSSLEENNFEHSTQSSELDPRTNVISLPLLIKTDNHGSLEAVQNMLYSCPSNRCAIECSQSNVGPLTISDVENANGIKATVLLFNVPALPDAQKRAEEYGVVIKHFNVIYRLVEEVRDLINARMPPIVVEQVVGEAEILALFTVRESRGNAKPLRLSAAGCRCTKGVLVANISALSSATERNSFKDPLAVYYRVIRPNKSAAHGQDPVDMIEHPTDPLHDGSVLISQAICHSLKHERSAVGSIRKNVECGLILGLPSTEKFYGDMEFFSDWQVGDVIQCYVLLNETQSINWEFDTRTPEQHH